MNGQLQTINHDISLNTVWKPSLARWAHLISSEVAEGVVGGGGHILLTFCCNMRCEYGSLLGFTVPMVPGSAQNLTFPGKTLTAAHTFLQNLRTREPDLNFQIILKI